MECFEYDYELNDSEINDSEINDYKINDSEINDSEINDSEINDYKINESKSLHWNQYIKLEVKEPIMNQIRNDLKQLKTKQYNYTIKITNELSNLFLIEINQGITLIGKCTLHFNHKYPFEAPSIQWKGPTYDFMTNLLLTFDCKIIQLDQWNINESVHSIIMYLIDTIDKKTIQSPNHLIWTEDEMNLIEWLHELNYFKNKSYFEEYKERLKGQGVGYSHYRENKLGGTLMVDIKRKKEIMWKKIYSILSEKKYDTIYNELNLNVYLDNYIERSSFLHLNEMKELFSLFYKNEELNNRLSMSNLNNMMDIFMQSPYRIELNEESINHHFFYLKYHKQKETINFQSLLKRILIDLCDLNVYMKEEKTIVCAFSEEYPQFFKLLIKSTNEPYIGGYFEFDVYIPFDYPNQPPQFQLITTGYGKIRFNPNLYADGKVCLSLLGTWAGEPWNPHYNNLTHIVQAISVMILTDQPVQNEPAYSSMDFYDNDFKQFENISTDLWMVKRYKFQIKLNVIQYALLYYFESMNQSINQSSNTFQLWIQQDFLKEKENILKSCQLYIDLIQNSTILSHLISAKKFQNNPISFETYENDLKRMMENIRVLNFE